MISNKFSSNGRHYFKFDRITYRFPRTTSYIQLHATAAYNFSPKSQYTDRMCDLEFALWFHLDGNKNKQPLLCIFVINTVHMKDRLHVMNVAQGPISLTIFPSQFKFVGNFI